MEQRNCAFQFVGNSKIIENKVGLTLSEAKELWNKYYRVAAQDIHYGNTVEMVIWINMENEFSFGEYLQYIDHNAESDGKRIWVTKKVFYDDYQNTEQ